MLNSLEYDFNTILFMIETNFLHCGQTDMYVNPSTIIINSTADRIHKYIQVQQQALCHSIPSVPVKSSRPCQHGLQHQDSHLALLYAIGFDLPGALKIQV